MKRTLGSAGVKLNELIPEDDDLRDYGNNPIRLLGTMNVLFETNGLATEARFKVIGGNRPSIIGRDLMPNLGLQIVQRTPEQKVMSVQGEQPEAETSSEEYSLDPWQTYFSKQFNNFFHRVGKIKDYKVQAEFFETLTPSLPAEFFETFATRAYRKTGRMFGQIFCFANCNHSEERWVSKISIRVKGVK